MYVKELGEFGLIDLFAKDWPELGAGVVRGIGDDCAVIDTGGDRCVLVTTDMLVEGVHFDLNTITPLELGVRSVAANLSDIAAMGGVPAHSFLSIGAPASVETSFMEEFIRGYREISLKHDCRLLGGDTVASPCVVINVVVMGFGEREKILYRHGAICGDYIYVSGYLGDSGAGLDLLRHPLEAAEFGRGESLRLRHLTPEPRVALGRLLGESKVNACIDLSDGIASDLGHICRKSGVGARIAAELLPVSPSAASWGRVRGVDPLEWALSGGEDFELLFCAPESTGEKIIRRAKEELQCAVSCVGEIVDGREIVLTKGGREERLGLKGYEHFKA